MPTMRYLHEKTGIVLRLGLLSLLLTAQSFAFTHELDHFSSGDNGMCTVCPVSNDLEVPAHVSHAPPETTPVTQIVSSRLDTIIIRMRSTPWTARAPPATS